MIESSRVNEILYGGDYNPEQWPEETWEKDMELLKQAHINVLTLNVFSWGLLQPEENRYDFSMLDRIMDMVRAHGFKVFLATSTGAHPAWMVKKYPDVIRVDGTGNRRKFGRRHVMCPNSPNYRKFSVALAGELAKRYADYDNIVAWHVNNEYNGACYCEYCERGFREWLKKRYGTLDKVNEAWNANFWSHTFHAWDEIVAPNFLSEMHQRWDDSRTTFQGIALDYARFMSDSLQTCFNLEKAAIKAYTPEIPVSTNLMGLQKTIDMYKWAKSMDFIAWDSYPSYTEEPAEVAMRHEIMRGLQHGRAFALVEQTPGVNNWEEYCRMKRPGAVRLLSYQAMAHGSDTVMFFQMKRSPGACEKFHGAVIDHSARADTRVFRDIASLGAELQDKLGSRTLGGRTKAEIAILFDWENWWAVEYSAGLTAHMDYIADVLNYYRALFQEHYSVDIVGVEEDFSNYKLVIAPLLYMTKDGFDEKLRAYVREGGTFVTTFFSGYVDESDRVISGGYPGKWQDIMGLWVEESDGLPPEERNSFLYHGKEYSAGFICDLLRPEGAEPLAVYQQDFYAGVPVIARNRFGKGTAWHIGTRSDESFYRELLTEICGELGILPILRNVPDGVEVTLRENENGSFLFLLNHRTEETSFPLQCGGTELLSEKNYHAGELLSLPGRGVAILRQG